MAQLNIEGVSSCIVISLIFAVCRPFTGHPKTSKFVTVVVHDDVICRDPWASTTLNSVLSARSLVQCCSECAKLRHHVTPCHAVNYSRRNKTCGLVLTYGYKSATGNTVCNIMEIVRETGTAMIANITMINQLAPVINEWIIIQQRIDDTVSFLRTWNEYKEGFGDLTGNFWLGLEAMYKLTASSPTLRVEVLAEGVWYVDIFKGLRVASEAEGYKIHVGGYSGTNGDVITKGYISGTDMQDMKFSTIDNDNDLLKSSSCADSSDSGWWHQKCFTINLNGPYGNTENFRYYLFKTKRFVPITACRMMIAMV